MRLMLDFVGSTVVCEVCRKEFELYENDLFRCEGCGGKTFAYEIGGDNE